MRAFLPAALIVAILAPAPAAAQTTDDLFNPDVIHRLDLLVNGRDWEKLQANFLTNEYYPADVTWNTLTVRNVGIRVRGLSTRSATKPALRVDMNRYTTGQQFLGLKSFLLDNLLSDPTGIKELVVMRLYQQMGLPAPREAHVALYVNNNFAGLYVIIESIDKDFLARVFGERTPGDTENDGHLFEYDWQDPWRWEYLGPQLEAYAPKFGPHTHEQGSMTELYGPIEELVRTINEGADFAGSMNSYLDLPLLMRQLAVQNFVAEYDGILGFNGTANFYLYRFEDSTRSQFIPWDEDRAFHATDWPIFQFHDVYTLTQRAMSVPALRTAYLDALLEVTALAMAPATADPQGPGWLENEVNTRRVQITSLMHADPLKPYTNEEFEAAMDALAAFAVPRAAYVRGVVAKER
jgi:spore coat protein CotH